jgi:3D (Asp-Asp-Asp) domain-containing protein
MGKSLIIRSLMIGFVSFLVWGGVIMPQAINADLNNTGTKVSEATLVYNGHLTLCKLDKTAYHVVRVIKNAVVTGYSSTKDQTDDTPWIGAGGDLRVPLEKGYKVLATNILPLGTKVRIGEDIFIVYDRMNSKYNGMKRFDRYFEGDGEIARQAAIKFGAKVLDIEIVES